MCSLRVGWDMPSFSAIKRPQTPSFTRSPSTCGRKWARGSLSQCRTSNRRSLASARNNLEGYISALCQLPKLCQDSGLSRTEVPMTSFPFVTLDVFTDRRFGGNPLAVFPDARGISDADMQRLAAEFNLSETTFVLPPADPKHTARVRIFNRTAEMPFAGHPNVGTGFVLAGMGRDTDGVLVFEEVAGLVEVKVERDAAGQVTGAAIAAPQPLSTGFTLTAGQVAQCCMIEAADVITARHPPIQASVGVDFVFAEVTPEGLAKAGPNLTGSREV